MRSRILRDAAVVALISAAACSDSIPTTPTATTELSAVTTGPLNLNATTTVDGQPVAMNGGLDAMNARLAASGARVRVAKAELRLDARRWDKLKGAVILARDFKRGIDAEWVRGDVRRGGRKGVNWQFGSNFASAPYVFTDDMTGFRPLSTSEQQQKIEHGMNVWRNLRCSADPIAKVPVPAGTDPDLLNDLVFAGAPSANYVQSSDIVHSGWQPLQFFQAFAGPDAVSILGATFTFVFTDDAGVPTDVDRNGQNDIALAELYYNDIFVWSNDGQPTGTLDFFSIIGHEAGHALGLGHWGLIWVSENDAADGISAEEIRFTPKALMNALYVSGQNEVEFWDRANFCSIWAGNGRRGR